MKIAVFGSKHQKKEQVEKLFSILLANNAEVYIQEKFYIYLRDTLNLQYSNAKVIRNDHFNADLVISIGGDGTFLRTTSVIGKKNIPILGINAGRLGFLADVGEKDLEATFADIFSGNYRIEHRSQLHLTTEHKDYHGFNYALNEIAILKQDSASMITVHTHIDGEFLTSYEADGLIIATPTGSTAYALSVGGPVMVPTAANFVIAAVAPHSLSNRPLVVPDSSIITLDIESRNNSFLISLDGRSNVFKTGTKLTISKADFSLNVIKRKENTFYNTLRNKLMWGIDPRQS
ncbi:NAD+ kinase [Dysgonomonas sp. PFB1-18]|uniref:NAD kinase n=1 Tax=unclassified Dysgonomonas TaxID=2630389 RepID=UPI002473338B|nr:MULTISPECIES: NAD kinase [unclassified Dysgonomonas]MDH6311034.1 NAD+ kinase [Dysgonomonas sp. PF1-14]MDH6337883.1 NAD+ kinase [Dysgonomonas sp. PF1-16]MDH6382582.1 NAD+ kinase [Dysgonomonas sp. PFB1-18]MDH6398015.1 NAD+ kinase [Dysgonomonas sp. PF1-23]